jgi:hypothetical protein
VLRGSHHALGRAMQNRRKPTEVWKPLKDKGKGKQKDKQGKGPRRQKKRLKKPKVSRTKLNRWARGALEPSLCGSVIRRTRPSSALLRRARTPKVRIRPCFLRGF